MNVLELIQAAIFWVAVGGGLLGVILLVIRTIGSSREERETAEHVARTKASNARLAAEARKEQ